MSASELQLTLEHAATALKRLGLSFHITGGLASSYYGEPRLTQDIDFVVQLDIEQGRQLVEVLQEEFIVESDAVDDAVSRRAMFQAIHRTMLIKADFHVGERIEGELQRSILRTLFQDLALPMVSKEDAILSKLIWTKEGSGKSRQDVLGMLLDPSPLDMDVVRKRARGLGCAQILEEIERQAKE